MRYLLALMTACRCQPETNCAAKSKKLNWRYHGPVVVRVGDNLLESAIARRSADALKLTKGDTVTAVVKAGEVMIQKD
jgi:molybdopterin-binding protein